MALSSASGHQLLPASHYSLGNALYWVLIVLILGCRSCHWMGRRRPCGNVEEETPKGQNWRVRNSQWCTKTKTWTLSEWQNPLALVLPVQNGYPPNTSRPGFHFMLVLGNWVNYKIWSFQMHNSFDIHLCWLGCGVSLLWGTGYIWCR